MESETQTSRRAEADSKASDAFDGHPPREFDGVPMGNSIVRTLGWEPSCRCKTELPPVMATVLDPFNGSGTTIWKAKRLNRIGIGFDISEEYCRLTVDRIRQQGLL